MQVLVDVALGGRHSKVAPSASLLAELREIQQDARRNAGNIDHIAVAWGRFIGFIEKTVRAFETAPPLEAQVARLTRSSWRCFHCDEVFTDEAEAREHFGADMTSVPACRLSTEDVKQLRALEALNDKLNRELALLENDARLWHESEADRVRRIGNVQWWQELDSREGEKLVLQEEVARLTRHDDGSVRLSAEDARGLVFLLARAIRDDGEASDDDRQEARKLLVKLGGDTQ